MSAYPRVDSGFCHLTPDGWVRRDYQPYPADRVETWSYDSRCPADDAKEQVCLRRIWTNAKITPERREDLPTRFGHARSPTPERNVTLECDA